MESRFLTVPRSSQQYQKLIEGTYSETERAIPVGSFNIRSHSQDVTFRLVPVKPQEKVNRFQVIWRGLRPKFLTITLAPLVLTLLVNWRLQLPIDWFLAGVSMVSMMFFHFAIFLLNDYSDHLKGVDQINQAKGSRIIQNGWVSGRSVKNWGFFNVGLGVILGIPALLSHPIAIGFIGGFGLVIVLGYSRATQRLKDYGMREIFISLCLGPLMVSGFSITISNQISVSAIFVGLIFGWMASLIFQIKALEEMVTTYQNRGGGLIQNLGFDRGKKFIWLQLLCLPLVAALLFYFTPLFIPLILSTICFLITCLFISRSISHSDSPMSSQLTDLNESMAIVHLKNAIFTAVLIVPL